MDPEGLAGCGKFDIFCLGQETAEIGIESGVNSTVGDVAGSAVDKLADSVSAALVEGLTAVGTLWVRVPTPSLTGNRPVGGTVASTPPGTAGLETVLGYVVWVSLGICVLSVMVAGVRLALPNSRSGDMSDGVTHLSRTLFAVMLISGAVALVSGLMARDSSDVDASDTVAFMQNSVYWYVLALAILSVVVGAARMAWEQRAQPGKDLVRSLLTLLVVSAFGLGVIGLCVTAADEFSSWIIERSLRDQGGTSFKDAVSSMLGVDTLAGDAVSAIAIIVVGLIAFIACLLQIVAMVVRGAMLVLLAGILPLAAAATNTEMGMSWFKKCVAWLVAFILYKPAAAIIYATAFRMVGSNTDEENNGLVTAVSGLGLMVLAIVALPALMRFVTPMVGAAASGATGGSVAALAAVPAMGAVSTSGRGSASGSHGSPATSGASGATGPSGATIGGGSGSAGTSGANGRPGSTGAGQPGAGSAPPAGAGAAPASGGAAASNGAAPASAASGGSAAAAAGPVGVAGAAAAGAAQATRQVAQRGAEAATETAQGAVSEGENK
jgi:hypothetical protein